MDGSAGVGVDEVAQKRAASTLAVVPENPPDSRGFVVAAFPSHPQTSRRASNSPTTAASAMQLSRRREDGVLLTRFDVIDTGRGIKPGDQARLFAAFEEILSGTFE